MNSQPTEPLNWHFHSARDQMIAEAHARPSQNIHGPAQILHLAFRANEEACQMFFDAVASNKSHGASRHAVFEISGLRVKLERHTEFMSCTVFQDELQDGEEKDLVSFLNTTFPMSSIEILVLLKLELFKHKRSLPKRLPDNSRLYGGRLRNGIEVRSSFNPNEDGFIQFFLHARDLTSDELGRRIQRLLEMETYRTMALLALPKAREISPQLSSIETELDELTTALRSSSQSNQQEDEAMFQKLTDLSESANVLATNSRYRFAASRAYSALFQQRISSLEEEKVGDIQTMTGFLRSRLEPAMATVESTAKRQQTVTDDLSRALVLLRTRIELNLNKGNQALLQSMDKRHDQQLKISQAVEGLSIIAITYYAVGLLSYVLKAIANQPFIPFSATLLTAVSVPFVLLAVWRGLHHIRMAWEEKKQ